MYNLLCGYKGVEESKDNYYCNHDCISSNNTYVVYRPIAAQQEFACYVCHQRHQWGVMGELGVKQATFYLNFELLPVSLYLYFAKTRNKACPTQHLTVSLFGV